MLMGESGTLVPHRALTTLGGPGVEIGFYFYGFYDEITENKK